MARTRARSTDRPARHGVLTARGVVRVVKPDARSSWRDRADAPSRCTGTLDLRVAFAKTMMVIDGAVDAMVGALKVTNRTVLKFTGKPSKL